MKKLFLMLLVASVATSSILAQKKVAVDTSKYMRNSICLMLMDEAAFDKAEIIKQSFVSLPVPDKYNDHNLAERVFDTRTLPVSNDDLTALDEAMSETVALEGAAKKKKGGFGKFMGGLAKSVAAEATGGLVGGGADKSLYAAGANKVIVQNNIAKKLADKWFINANGEISTDLIFERGLYNFSAEEIAAAKESVKGVTREAQDSGFELLNSTFVIMNHFNYLPKDSVVAEMTAAASAIGAIAGYDVSGVASLAGTAATMALGEGYFVKITSYLFKLRWNDEIQEKLFTELWGNPQAYADSKIFTCQYIGSEKAFANVKSSIFKNRPEEELIYMATVNAVDAVLAKLEKKYDVFKTKTPLIINEGPDGKPVYTAKIGLKEGLEAGDKYEVLEQVYNEKTNKTEYKKVGELKVSKNQIWDNRFGADEELKEKGEEAQAFTETLFEGSVSKAQPGMLLRQIK